MNVQNLSMGLIGLGVVFAFLVLILVYSMGKQNRSRRPNREIAAFSRLKRGIGLAVEDGTRLHIALGHGGLDGLRGASVLAGLSMLQRIAKVAWISDRPPIATSGEAVQSILSQDTLRSSLRSIGPGRQFDPTSGQLCGLTPFSYAVGTLPLIYDQQVSVNLLMGSFGSEIALILDAAERNHSVSLAGSENLAAQAVLYAAAQEPLIGEELYVAGAYIQPSPVHLASLRAQDLVRWVLIGIIFLGVVLKLIGVL